jgi:hypothetical protein
MSALIAKEKTDGTVVVAFVAFSDSPYPLAETLLDHYTDEEKVEGLIALGSMPFVTPEGGKRREGARQAKPVTVPEEAALVALAALNQFEHVYLWKEGMWTTLEVMLTFVPLRRSGV